MAHPELPATGLVQPVTLQERLAHAQLAEKRLGGTIPWLVDPIDNRFKRAMGDRPNSEFIMDPTGRIVRKRAWSDPLAVRKDLEELVGKAGTLTRPEDAGTNDILTADKSAAATPNPKVSRAGLFPLVTKPDVEGSTAPFYVKLRCEGELTVIDEGSGKLYLGFHLDPLYNVHWNNLNDPLRFELKADDAVQLSQRKAEATGQAPSVDSEPREFVIHVSNWPKDQPIRLTVDYSACTDDTCHVVRQHYVIRRMRDIDGGAAPTAAFRGLDAAGMRKLLMAGDKNQDGKLVPEELNSIQRPRFSDYDLDRDGFLNSDEIQKMAVQNTSQKEL